MFDKEVMRKQLQEFRANQGWLGIKYRLNNLPFNDCHALFCVNEIPGKNLTRYITGNIKYNYYTYMPSPCTIFGRNLVLKIVDELLDE